MVSGVGTCGQFCKRLLQIAAWYVAQNECILKVSAQGGRLFESVLLCFTQNNLQQKRVGSTFKFDLKHKSSSGNDTNIPIAYLANITGS